jgi:inosine-uridine nucleoside N-ribohydrolase
MVEEVGTASTPCAQYIKKYGTVGFPLWDETGASVALDPSIVTKSMEFYVDVDTSFTAGYGNTLSWDAEHRPGLGENKVFVVQEVDVAKLDKMFVSLMQAPTPPAPKVTP